jgi:hypothetical protein
MTEEEVNEIIDKLFTGYRLSDDELMIVVNSIYMMHALNSQNPN